MPYVCDHGQIYRIRVKSLSSRRASHPPRVPLARALSDGLRLSRWAAWVTRLQPTSKLANVLDIQKSPPLGFALPPQGPSLGILQAFPLSPLQSRLLDQKALPFVPLASPTEANNHRPEG